MYTLSIVLVIEPVFDFIKDIFSFEDPLKSITALLGCLALSSLIFIEKSILNFSWHLWELLYYHLLDLQL
jgi:hypothetical protein